MRLFYHDDSDALTYDQVVEGCKTGYGINHPEKISGFNSYFFRLADIYLVGELEEWCDRDPRIEVELQKFIKRYEKEDYGFVTRAESNNNSENRWLCGSCSWTVGRYYFEDEDLASCYGGVVLEFFQDQGLLYSFEESSKWGQED